MKMFTKPFCKVCQIKECDTYVLGVPSSHGFLETG